MSRASARAEARARTRRTRARGALVMAVGVCVLAGVLVILSVAGGPAPAGPPGSAASTAPAGDPVAGTAATPPGERATVVGVADPVTLDVRLPGREVVRVRALGIEPGAPCYAEEAATFARRILGRAEVQLVPGPAGDVTDPFDRRLLQVVLDGNDYAVLAAEAGVARTYTVGADDGALVPIRAAEARARDAGRGFWAADCEPPPTAGAPTG